MKEQTSRANVTLSAVVTRADGTIEDLGIIAYYHKNPIKRLIYWLTGRGLN